MFDFAHAPHCFCLATFSSLINQLVLTFLTLMQIHSFTSWENGRSIPSLSRSIYWNISWTVWREHLLYWSIIIDLMWWNNGIDFDLDTLEYRHHLALFVHFEPNFAVLNDKKWSSIHFWTIQLKICLYQITQLWPNIYRAALFRPTLWTNGSISRINKRLEAPLTNFFSNK